MKCDRCNSLDRDLIQVWIGGSWNTKEWWCLVCIAERQREQEAEIADGGTR